jgi:predicted nuclease of predicted toxin-antitoxin system
MGVSPRTVAFLRSLGHEAIRLHEIGLDRTSDSDVIARAVREGQVVLTFDLDYPALLALRTENRVSAVIIRTVSADSAWVNARLAECLPLMASALQEGAIVVLEDGRIRIRKFVDLPPPCEP